MLATFGALAPIFLLIALGWLLRTRGFLGPSFWPGAEWLVDHVHPSIDGHRRIADALADLLIDRGIVRPTRPDWRASLAGADRDRLEGLDPDYFIKARLRLANEQGWARGRSTGGRAGRRNSPSGFRASPVIPEDRSESEVPPPAPRGGDSP